jgi:hypothetical protein
VIWIRRQVREPCEAMPWHVDPCRRFTVVVRGELLRIEFRETGDSVKVPVHPGMAEWDEPGAGPSRRECRFSSI